MIGKFKAGLSVVGVASAMMIAAPAVAQDQGFYAGLTLGQSKQKDACDGLGGGVSCDDNDTAWRILGGYQFHKNIAAEIAYGMLIDKDNVEVTTLEAVAVGIFPVTPNISLLGKLGFAQVDVEVGGPGGGSSDDIELTYGFGVQWDFTRNLGFRAGWQRYDADSEVDYINVGVIWKF